MFKKKPDWLKIKVEKGRNIEEVHNMLKKLSLNTVCKEANCPNLMECFNKRTATFMILGSVCTRNCTFCNVTKGEPQLISEDEPENVAKAVVELGLSHVVITSVTRDDLLDGGSEQFARVIKEIRKAATGTTIEVLIPDFNGNIEALRTVVEAAPDIINHNIETVPSLYSKVRPMAVYERSLELLQNVKLLNPSIFTKSGIMVGLGENEEEVVQVMKDLRKVGCDLLTIGQYLAPSDKHHPVIEYVHPDVFSNYKEIGIQEGFKYVASSPFVRSSYHASEVFANL